MQQQTFALPAGLALSDIARPGSVDDLSDLLRMANKRNVPVIPIGGGTSISVGNPVDVMFLGVDLRGMRGVRSYEAADLTASFHAGTTLDEVSEVLGEHGQELPLDLPQTGTGTIGGLVATGFSGPRRLGSGTLKDLLIGCGYVRGDGLAAKAGGMLVKNVSGFEISRLLHGSWGSLAILTSVNLKVVPKPKADFTFSRGFDTLDDALAAQMLVMERHPLITASVIERASPGWSMHVRVLGRETSLRSQVASIEADLGEGSDLVEDDRFWRGFNERWSVKDGGVRLVLGSRPRLAPDIARQVAHIPGVTAMAVSVPTGSVRVAIDPEALPVTELRRRLGALQASSDATWVIESMPMDWHNSLSTWSEHGSSSAVMRSIKQQFDPAGVLNRGRLFIQESG